MNDPEYKYSGATGDALRLLPAVGVPAILVLSALIAGLDFLARRVVEVPIFTSMLSVIAIGSLTGALCRRARCRNIAVARLLGFALGLYMLYVNWVWFEAYLFPAAAGEGANVFVRFSALFVDPRSVWAHARAMAAEGFEGFGSHWRLTTYQGAELWIAWAVDAVWTVGAITWLTRQGVSDEVFCEQCGKWAAPWKEMHLLKPRDAQALERAKAGEFETALAFEPDPSSAALPRLRLVVHRCDGCGLLHVWQLNEVKEVSSRGSRSVSTSTISPFYVLSQDEVSHFLAKQFP